MLSEGVQQNPEFHHNLHHIQGIEPKTSQPVQDQGNAGHSPEKWRPLETGRPGDGQSWVLRQLWNCVQSLKGDQGAAKAAVR